MLRVLMSISKHLTFKRSCSGATSFALRPAMLEERVDPGVLYLESQPRPLIVARIV